MRLRLYQTFLVLLITLWTQFSWGIIVERGVSSSGDTGSPLVTTLTFPHNSGSGESDCIIFVGVATFGTGMATVTYAGQALAKGVESSAGPMRCEIWSRSSPATGSNDVFLQRASTSSIRFTAGAITLCGVDQGTPFRTPNQNFNGTTTNVSHGVTSGTGELVLAVIANPGSTNGVTTGSGQNQEWNDQTTNATSSSNVIGVGSTEPGAGTVTIEYGLGASEDYEMCTISIRPSGAPAGSIVEGLMPIIQ